MVNLKDFYLEQLKRMDQVAEQRRVREKEGLISFRQRLSREEAEERFPHLYEESTGGSMSDRSGRTYEQYRELYWIEKKQRKALQSKLDSYIESDGNLRAKVKELEARLQQAQKWHDYYRARYP